MRDGITGGVATVASSTLRLCSTLGSFGAALRAAQRSSEEAYRLTTCSPVWPRWVVNRVGPAPSSTDVLLLLGQKHTRQNGVRSVPCLQANEAMLNNERGTTDHGRIQQDREDD